MRRSKKPRLRLFWEEIPGATCIRHLNFQGAQLMTQISVIKIGYRWFGRSS